jgi:transmembrane sensor
MTQSQFDQLLENHRTGTATKEDEALLESWYLQYGRRPSELRIKEVELAEIEMRQYIFKHIQDKPNLYLKNRLKIATWAAAVLLITVGFLYYNTPFFGNSAHKNAVKQQENEVLPGKNTATLTLANGKSISLSEAKTGIHFEDSKLSYNDHTSVFKSDSRHKNSENEQNLDEISLSGKIEMLTATTPKGGTYQVVLSDGTKIWLRRRSASPPGSQKMNAK